MKHVTYKTNKKALTYYMLALLALLLFINLLIISQQRTLFISENERFVNNEITIFSKLTQTSLITKDYANIEESVSAWGEDSRSIINITLTSHNNFVIAKYIRNTPSDHPATFSRKLSYGNDNSAILNVIVSQDDMHHALIIIAAKLIASTIVLIIFFGFLLWRILLRTAINPLQNEIIQHQLTTLQLTDAKAAAEKANKSKSEFLANMSHEIRTPMNGVLGMLSLLLDTKLTDKQHDFARTAYNSGDTLLIILNDILDFSKIEAGKLDIETISFNPVELFEETITLMATSAQTKNLELAFEIDPKTPPQLMGDAGRIRQILTNLISNAIKFTEKGEILITAHTQLDTDKKTTSITVNVQDTGIGISEENQKNIFNAFEQADSSTTRIYGGTGLGLSISKKLCQLMGGEMRLEQSTPQGSLFSFTLPFKIAQSTETPPSSCDQTLIGKNILIVDDNKTNRKILEHLCEQWELNFSSADSAKAALALIAKSHQNNQTFDIIITDMMMPEINGNELTELIKNDPRNQNTPVILLTSISPGQTTDNKLINDKLFNNILMKPAKQSMLFDALISVVNTAAAPTSSKDKNDIILPFRDYAALLAEDNITNQRVAEGMLKKLGFAITTVENGQEALTAITQFTPDIIFMDCQMPVLDGYAATEAIRNLELPLKNIIIVAMTANAMQEDKGKCLLAGMNDYISKPLRYEKIYETAKKWLPIEQQSNDSGLSENNQNLLDLNTIDSLRSIINDDFVKIIEEFYTTTKASIQDLVTLDKESETESAIKLLHTLKGSSANIGASKLSFAFLQLEQQLKQNSSIDITKTISEIYALLENTASEFRKIL